MSSAKRITLFAGVFTLAVVSWSTSVHAGEARGVAAIPTAAFVRLERLSVQPAVPARHGPFGSAPLTSQALGDRRGGDRVFNDAQLKGVVSDNQASNVTTGMNVISDGAFSGSAGLSTVIQNSGNNVLIQNATIVNVQMK